MTDDNARLWLHGLLDLCLLGLLDQHRDYGLALAGRLETAGFGSLPGGTLYPALLRLETTGLVTASREPSPTGPPRKYFEITAAGRESLVARRQEWHRFSRRVDGVLGDLTEGAQP